MAYKQTGKLYKIQALKMRYKLNIGAVHTSIKAGIHIQIWNYNKLQLNSSMG